MRRALSCLLLVGSLVVAGCLSLPGAGAAAEAPYTVTTLHFKVSVGPDRSQVCDIVGDVYRPRTATRTNRVPAILTTNGFGGSKDDQAGIGKAFASRGYVVLSYSGLGFGGSDCKITLDDPDYDGVAGRQLVSYLGGAGGIAFLDDAHTQPAPRLDVVRRDARAHDGRRHANDPRVGMVGGSYGGQIQFAVASVDPRLDAIVPIITWNDLAYSLGPNNTDLARGVTSRTPGTTKLTWGLLFSTLGVVQGFQNAQTDPSRVVGCPNFAFFVCPALVTAGSTGYFQPDAVASLRHASVASYLGRIRIPTLLVQGEKDTLFNLNEAVATYRALQAQGTEVKMIWQSWGHSDSSPAPGELDLGALDPKGQYEAGRVFAWFNHHLKGDRVSTGPEFAYFRDWIHYSGNAAPAYGTASQFPVGTERSYYLSGTRLVRPGAALAASSRSLVTPAAGAPTSTNPPDAIGGYVQMPVPEQDLPGTALAWDGGVLGSAVDVVGSPRLRLQVSAPLAAATQASGPAGQLVLFVRVQDVGPDGTAHDISALTAPVRVPDVGKPFTVTLPGFVHRFAPGHRIRLVVAGGSLNYRGGLTANPVSISTGTTVQRLTLPVVD